MRVAFVAKQPQQGGRQSRRVHAEDPKDAHIVVRL
jgi:hypothetical protein